MVAMRGWTDARGARATPRIGRETDSSVHSGRAIFGKWERVLPLGQRSLPYSVGTEKSVPLPIVPPYFPAASKRAEWGRRRE